MGRFISPDSVDVVTLTEGIYDKNLYAYCDNNPVMRVDTDGYFWDIFFDVVSLVASVVEVVANPTDGGAWLGLAGDVVDLVPFVTGVGETVKAVRTSKKVIEKTSETVVEVAKTVYKNADKASDIRKATGSYEIMYKSGSTYVGKGGYKRTIKSAEKHAKDNLDEVTSIKWKKASNNREAFVNEYKSMCKYGGPNNTSIGNESSYNKIWSPGRSYYYEDFGYFYSYGGRIW